MSYPLGMNSKPSSGYNHKSTTYNRQYVTWKGSGVNSNPVGTAPGHIRPLTNNDPGNVFQTGFGLPRPIKHFRKGRVIPPQPITGVPNLNGINENALINYNINRFVKSSKGSSLGGGAGGSGLIDEMQDKPGAFIIKENPINEVDGVTQMNADCQTCEGVGVIADYYPNKSYLTENPEPNTQNSTWCCNEEYKAKRRVIYASTNLKKNYYTSTKQYLQNRCKTYDQKAFNFLSYRTNLDASIYNANPYYATPAGNNAPVPGSPLSFANTYLANCQPNVQIYDATENALISQMLSIMVNAGVLTQSEVNTFNTLGINTIDGFFNWLNGLPEGQKEPALQIFVDFINNPYWGMPLTGPSNQTGCQLTVYKPNNYQYAVQGAVDSSTRNLKLTVDTITSNAKTNKNSYLSKNKSSTGCNTPLPLNFSQSGPYQNKKLCYYKALPQYQVPVSQQGSYRYFPGTVFSSNHFSQSPNTYNTTSGSAAYIR